MKIMVYEARPDERADLEKQAALHGVELSVTDAVPTLENASLAAGCIGVSILGQGCIDAALLDAYHALGIRYLSTRTIGYDHIDLDHARSIGLRVCSASYAPNGVADFTVMMILMCLRHYKQALWRGQVNDFSLTGLQGREMKDLTIGIIGTGRIGAQVARNLSGFGCRILAYDLRRNPAVEPQVTYVDFDTLLAQSDVITLHMPLLDSNRHIINRESIAKMPNRNWFYLHQFRNVIMTQHMAFYTDAAVSSMVDCGIGGICQMAAGESCPTELTGPVQ